MNRYLTAGVSGIALICGAAANAQDTAQNDDQITEIVVTAQFRAQSLQDTPIAITAVNAEMLEARSQTDLAQIANQAPSVTLKSQSAVFGPALGANIRGIGQYDPSPAVEPGVGIYVDDVYYATLTGSVLELLDLDRVEILRGPQGTLSGRNSIGGAIKLFSRKPDGENAARFSVTYGSRDRLDLRGSADFALSDSLFARVSGVSRSQDGYVDRLDFGCVNAPGSALNPGPNPILPQASSDGDCVLARDGGVDTRAARAQLRFDNGGPVEINLIGDYTRETRGPAAEILVFAGNTGPWVSGDYSAAFDDRFICGPRCNYANYFNPAGISSAPFDTGAVVNETSPDPTARFEGWGVSGQIDADLTDNLNLTSITAYRAYNSTFGNDNDLTPLANSAQDIDLDFWSVSQELRLNASLGELVDLTIGGFYIDQETINGAVLDLRFTPFALQFYQNDPVRADSKAVFGQAIFNLTDKFTLVGGLRYTKESKTYSYIRRNYDGTLNPWTNPPGNPIDGRSETYRGDHVDWRIAAQYEIAPEYMVYASAATGFKGGGVNPRPFSVFQVVPFEPETVTSYELGVKTDLLDRRLRLNLAGYYSDYRDIQLGLLSCPQFSDPTTTADDNGPCQAIANAGDADIWGFEVEAQLRPVAGLSLDGALSYTNFEYKRINPLAGGAGNPGGPQLDDVAPYTPEWKWSLGAQYEFVLGDGSSLTPRFDVSYQSDAYSNPPNNPLELVPSYALANGRITWRNADEDLTISAEVTNLFDEYYFPTVFDNSLNAGYATRQVGRPREWAVTVAKSF